MSTSIYQPAVLRDQSEGEAIADCILFWWSQLVDDRELLAQYDADHAYPGALRATLRRATTPDEVLLTEAFRHLWLALPRPQQHDRNMLAWACTAAVLAEIRTHNATAFARAMAQGKDPTDTQPRASELRFRKLLQSRDLNELMRNARRMVQLLGNSVDVVSVADGILQWHREHSSGYSHRPEKRLAVRWASDYYDELKKTEKAR